MNKRKPSARSQAEIAVKDYQANKMLLDALRADAINGSRVRPEVQIYSKGHDRDDTARRGCALLSIQHRRIEEDIYAVQYAIGMCSYHPQGKRIRHIIEAVYWDDVNPRRKYQLAIELKIPPERVGRLANMFLDWVSLWYAFPVSTSNPHEMED